MWSVYEVRMYSLFKKKKNPLHLWERVRSAGKFIFRKKKDWFSFFFFFLILIFLWISTLCPTFSHCSNTSASVWVRCSSLMPLLSPPTLTLEMICLAPCIFAQVCEVLPPARQVSPGQEEDGHQTQHHQPHLQRDLEGTAAWRAGFSWCLTQHHWRATANHKQQTSKSFPNGRLPPTACLSYLNI